MTKQPLNTPTMANVLGSGIAVAEATTRMRKEYARSGGTDVNYEPAMFLPNTRGRSQLLAVNHAAQRGF